MELQSLLEVALSNVVVASVLALIAAALGALRVRPALVHAAWLLVLVKLVTPPLFAVSVALPIAAVPKDVATDALARPVAVDAQPIWPGDASLFEHAAAPLPFATDLDGQPFEEVALAPVVRPAAATTSSTSVAATNEPAPTFLDDVPWTPVLFGAWALGALVILASAAVRSRRFDDLLQHALPAPPALQREVARLAEELDIERVPAVQLLPGRVSPMLWASLGDLARRRARLLLPRDLLERLDAEERATLLTHELAHLRRRDHVVRYFELFARAMHWWNPLAWWAGRELRSAAEDCCDAWVVWLHPTGSRRYANALLETAAFLSNAPGRLRQLPVTAAGAAAAENLKWRLLMILKAKTPRALDPIGRTGMFGLALLALPLLPTTRQDAEPEPVAVTTPEPRVDPALTLLIDSLLVDVEGRERVADPLLVELAQDATPEPLGDGELEALRALGYVDTTTPAADPAEPQDAEPREGRSGNPVAGERARLDVAYSRYAAAVEGAREDARRGELARAARLLQEARALLDKANEREAEEARTLSSLGYTEMPRLSSKFATAPSNAGAFLGRWKGTFDQHSHGVEKRYEMIVHVNNTGSDGSLSGRIHRPELEAWTMFSGSYVNGVLHLHEDTLELGSGLVLGGDYWAFATADGRLQGRAICGKDGDHKEAFVLSREDVGAVRSETLYGTVVDPQGNPLYAALLQTPGQRVDDLSDRALTIDADARDRNESARSEYRRARHSMSVVDALTVNIDDVHTRMDLLKLQYVEGSDAYEQAYARLKDEMRSLEDARAALIERDAARAKSAR